MTDKEIKSAMEACLNRTDRCVCTIEDCPYAWEDECSIDLWKDALDLINRQQAEIDRLTEWNKIKIEEMRQERQEMLARNKKFRADIIEKNEKMFLEAEAQIRPQAIKEFAEKLKEDIRYRIDATGDFELYEAFQDIDSLVKEMVGADNGKRV